VKQPDQAGREEEEEFKYDGDAAGDEQGNR
jgi:hypothetical protein